MSTTVLVSAKASPGVTTSVLALASVWREDRAILIVEADPDGGVLAARCGLSTEPGLATLAVTGRRDLTVSDIAAHSQPLPGRGVDVLLGPPSAVQARRALALSAPSLGVVLRSIPSTDVLIDGGRLTPDSPTLPLTNAADALVLVARPRLDELQLLHSCFRIARANAPAVHILLVGDRPYPPSEVAGTLEVDALGVIAHDPRSAAALTGDSRGPAPRRSQLLRSARDAAASLVARLDELPGPDGVASGEPIDAERDDDLATTEVAP